MTARLLLRALWRQRLVALLLLLLTLVSTNLYLRSVPRVYTATASVAIVPGPSSAGFGELSGPLLGTLVDQARGNDVLGAAVSRVDDAPTIEALRGATTVQAVTDAFTLRVSVALEDPALAAELANRIASALPSFNLVPERVAYRPVDVARPPSSPSSPQERLVLAVGTLLGLALAVAGALLLDDARRRVEDPAELAEVAGAPVLARIRRPRDPRTLPDAADEATTADLRSIRVGLAAAGARSSIVIAGVNEDDDDRWLSTSTALGLATVHRRVLLVLASPSAVGPDAVRPRHARVEQRGEAVHEPVLLPGLSEALRGREVAALTQPGRVPSLSVLGPGTEPELLPGLLESGFEALLAKLEAEYDVVVVDAPPLAASDDARVLATDGRLLLWTRLGRTGQRQLQTLLEDVRTVRATVVGCVAVDAPGRLGARRRPRRR